MPLRATMGKVFRHSSAARLFAIAFVGTHLPLLALVGWLLVRSGPQDGRLAWVGLAALLATVVGIVLTIGVLPRLLDPVRAAAEALEAYDRRQQLPELPEHGGDEVARLMRGINRIIRRIDDALRELRTMALRDSLTRVYNRRGCQQTLAESVEAAASQGFAFHLAVVDLDNLKPINDQYGHAAGDKALVDLAESVLGILGPDEWLGRWGGDEFMIGFRGDAGEVRARVLEWLARLTGTEPPLQASVGLASLRPGLSAQALYRQADEAMYRAKQAGGHRIDTGAA